MNRGVAAARTVLVVGQDADPGAIGFIERAARPESEVVLLSLGYPISKNQQALVSAALALVAETHTGLDAILVPDAEDLTSCLQPEDRVAIFASSAERRAVERVMRRLSAQDSPAGGASSSASTPPLAPPSSSRSSSAL